LNPIEENIMDDLLREAIADAKSVRETALANAKIALEEAFTPRLQSMLSRKIESEMEAPEEEEMEMAPEEDEELAPEEQEMDAEESELELAPEEEMELDAEESEMEAPEEEEEMEEQAPLDAEEDDVHPVEEEEAEAEESEMEAEEEDELDLESVLKELEADLEKSEEDELEEEYEENQVGDGMNTDEVEVDSDKLAEDLEDSSEIGKADNKVDSDSNDSSDIGAQGPEGKGSDKEAGKENSEDEVVDNLTEQEDTEEEDDIDLDEVLKALSEEEDAEEEADKVEELKKEITEHRKVISFMRGKLNEVNLLNAKLLFSNKLFRAFGLNNNQKLKVVENFDRTKNLREVKLVYATLAESFKRPGKLSEAVSKGSSSKPTRSTKPAKAEVLSEGQEMRNRFKKLANIL
tara:strand:+ start:695 stop:1912 length:1218 start_codon:yes stop_codon:yes gene_type:complete